MKNFFIVLFNMIFINFAFALTPIEVKNDFKNEIGTLKVYPMINDGYSTKVNYLAGNTFNQNILTKYDGGNTPEINSNQRISITPPNEYYNQCVAFIKGVTNAKSTSSWRRGSAISVLTQKYAVIATFSSDGFYENNHKSHVAIYIAQTNEGIYVLDQNFRGSFSNPVGEIAVRLIPWTSNSTSSQAKASNYYIVEQ